MFFLMVSFLIFLKKKLQPDLSENVEISSKLIPSKKRKIGRKRKGSEKRGMNITFFGIFHLSNFHFIVCESVVSLS